MRFRQRHVHATIVQHVRTALTAAGWVNDPVNFGTTRVTILDYEPQEAGETPAFNTVAVSMGHEGEDRPFEMGGGLYECRYTVFVDIYGTNEPTGIAIGEDVKDALTEQIITLLDFTSSPSGAATDGQIEFESVVVDTIPSAASTLDKRSWRSVKATAVCFF